MQATIALIPDGTVAIEVDVCSVLLQWPFLSDISLGLAAASIFQAPVSSEDPQDAAQAAAVQVRLKPMSGHGLACLPCHGELGLTLQHPGWSAAHWKWVHKQVLFLTLQCSSQQLL